MADKANRLTDEKLEEIEKRLSDIYSRAEKEIQKTIDDYFAKFAKRDAKQKARLEAGEITEQEYKQWRLAQMGSGERFKALQKRVAERYTKANQTAVSYVNDATPGRRTTPSRQSVAWSTNTASITSTARTETPIFASAPGRRRVVRWYCSICRMSWLGTTSWM